MLRPIAIPQHFSLVRLLLAGLTLGLAGMAASCTPPPVAPIDEPPEAPEEPLPPLPEAPREFRAAWIATVDNIDWPSQPGLSVAEQKAELRAMLDQAAALNLNAVIFQVRPAADALYDSPYEPWSEYLTGAMGRSPEPYYDPLAFAVKEAHKRGLELHAWFNPFRAHHPSATSPISPDHVSREHPEWVVPYGGYLWLDPGLETARDYTSRVIMDVVRRYDIDGVHFDDYFYPYPSYADGAPFPDDASWERAQAAGAEQSRAGWRRENVNRLIRHLHRTITRVKPHVKFGISPFGIWRPGHPPSVEGFDAYANLYADARKWLREGWVDYLTPQLYWPIDQVGQRFPVLLEWWVEQNWQDRHVWPGLYTSGHGTDGSGELIAQIRTTREQPGATGHVHFSMKALMNEALVERLRTQAYARPALVPASPWLDGTSPGRPQARLTHADGQPVLRMRPAKKARVGQWVVYCWDGAAWTLDVLPGERRRYVLKDRQEAVAVSAVSRSGIEGPSVVLRTEKGAPVTERERGISAW